MKTWKHGIIGILAIITLAFGFIACDDGNGEKDPVCECNPKEHYLACTCPVVGTSACTCQIIPRGYLTERDGDKNPTGRQIPIWQKTGVTDEQADTAKENIITGYNEFLPPNMTGDLYSAFIGKIKEIWIVKETQDDPEKYGNANGYFDYEIDNNQIIINIQYASPYFVSTLGWLQTNVLPTLD